MLTQLPVRRQHPLDAIERGWKRREQVIWHCRGFSFVVYGTGQIDFTKGKQGVSGVLYLHILICVAMELPLGGVSLMLFFFCNICSHRSPLT